MKKLLTLGIVLLLNGCASSSGVMQLAPNTYTLSVGVAGARSVSGNDTKAKRSALMEANEYCKSKGKQIFVENTKMNSTYGGSTNELIFKCLTDAEANLQKNTKYQQEPNIVIENR